MPGGRPTDYRPEYCQTVIECGEKGFSVVEMAAHIGCHRNTLETLWPAKHPEFMEALTSARELSQAWWERAGREGMHTPGFGGNVWSRSMASRFPRDWTERKQTEIAGNLAIESRTTIDPSLLTDQHREALRAIAQSLLAPPVIDGEFEEVGDE